jgi:tRNA threonylcarbamoyladenosine biosynthesis protein TsaB
VSTILCIDTASDRFALALDRDGFVTSLEAEAARDHSKLLLPAIASLLGDERMLEAILVVTGPGAYAGIRVGIATAEGLALAHEAETYGIGTLEAVALARRDEGELGALATIHPAGRGEFAFQQFEAGAPAGAVGIAMPDRLEATSRGEGAGRYGGIEVTPLERAQAALRDRAPRIRSGELAAGVDAFYLREPNITVSRRQRVATS